MDALLVIAIAVVAALVFALVFWTSGRRTAAHTEELRYHAAHMRDFARVARTDADVQAGEADEIDPDHDLEADADADADEKADLALRPSGRSVN